MGWVGPSKCSLPKSTDKDRLPRPSTIAGGRVAATVDPLGRRTDIEYDNRNRKTRVILPPVTLANGVPTRAISTTAYDAVGNVVSTTDPRGNTTTTQYDGANRPFLVTDPLGKTTESVHDQNGNVVEAIDANGNITRNIYNALDQLVTTTDPEGISVHNEYDQDGNLSAVTDGNGNRTEFLYDGAKRLLKKTHPDGSFEAYTYNAINQISRTDEKGQVTTFTHDDRHRLVTATFSDGNVRTITYDLVGNQLSVTESLHNGKADVSNTYDNLNRVLSETTGGVTHHFEYDLVGNRIKTTVGHTGLIIEATYNALGKLTGLIDVANNLVTTYKYDINGNLVERYFSNGQKVVCTYDALNRSISRTATANGQPLQTFTYTYDNLVNVTKMVESYAMEGVGDRVVNIGYDRNYRLKEEDIFENGGAVMSTRYVYDAASNRTNKTVFGGPNPGSINSVYNNLNQLISATNGITGKTATFSYDLNGNRIKQTRSDGQVTDYVYDPSNRLISVSDAGKVKTIDISGPNGLKTQAHFTVDSTYGYTYDYRTRRIARDENGKKTDIVFLGGTSVMEFEGAGNGAAPNRAAGTVPTVEYVRGSDLGGGIGGILYSLRPDETNVLRPSFTWYNNRGDVVAKTGSDGTLSYQAAYEAFGSRTQEKGETEDRQRANTREETAWGGLYENMRWRDLETGTYLTRDPAGFVDGPNLYAYVRQNPWTSFDAFGLEITGKEAKSSVSGLRIPVYDDNGELERVYNQSELDDYVETLPEQIQNILGGDRWEHGAHYYLSVLALMTGGNMEIPPTESQRKTAEATAAAEARKENRKWSTRRFISTIGHGDTVSWANGLARWEDPPFDQSLASLLNFASLFYSVTPKGSSGIPKTGVASPNKVTVTVFRVEGETQHSNLTKSKWAGSDTGE